MCGFVSGSSAKRKGPTVEVDLFCTLEELFRPNVQKKRKITRTVSSFVVNESHCVSAYRDAVHISIASLCSLYSTYFSSFACGSNNFALGQLCAESRFSEMVLGSANLAKIVSTNNCVLVQ